MSRRILVRGPRNLVANFLEQLRGFIFLIRITDTFCAVSITIVQTNFVPFDWWRFCKFFRCSSFRLLFSFALIDQSTHRFKCACWTHIAGLFEETDNISSFFVPNFFLVYYVAFEVILVSILGLDWRNLHVSFSRRYNFSVHLEKIIGGLASRLRSSIHDLNKFSFASGSHFGRKRRVLFKRDQTISLIWQDGGVSFLPDSTYFVHSFDCFGLVFRKGRSLFGHTFIKTLACFEGYLFDGNFWKSCWERAKMVLAFKISRLALIFAFLLDPRKSAYFVLPHCRIICLADSNWVKSVWLHVVTGRDDYFGSRFVSRIHKLLNLFLRRLVKNWNVHFWVVLLEKAKLRRNFGFLLSGCEICCQMLHTIGFAIKNVFVARFWVFIFQQEVSARFLRILVIFLLALNSHIKLGSFSEVLWR